MKKIIDRLDEYMILKGLNDNQVTVNCGLSVGLLGKARKGTGDLGKSSVERILKFYTDIDRRWLLTGEGEMLKTETTNTGHPIIPSARDADDRFDRLMKIVETQSKQMEVQSKQIEMLLNKIDRLEKQESGEGPRPNEASDHT